MFDSPTNLHEEIFSDNARKSMKK